ncbi:helix-turn-helix domain-containing protein (plasmid) [Streptomyces sp. BI20]|uniref:helix-turn-helix domain-containing protein n=1 Tax=Streptomyces sp. BI20 TaxID=3403460 RepID=UPI003C777F22
MGPRRTRQSRRQHSRVNVTLTVTAVVEGAMPNLNDAVDALLEQSLDLPAPAARARLRKAAKLTQEQVAEALGVTRYQVIRWERGTAEPRQPHLAAYRRLLDGLAARHPGAVSETAPSN